MSKRRPTYDELLVEYHKLAKKADRRLINLEKLAQTEEFKSATRFAYKKAARDAAEWGASPTKPRFDTKPPGASKYKTAKQNLQEKISDINRFLAADTSTKRGIIGVYKKAAASLNTSSKFIKRDAQGNIIPEKSYDINLTWDQLKAFFDTQMYKDLSKKLGSETAVKALTDIRRNRMTVYKAIKNSQKNDIITSEKDEIVSTAIDEAINKYPDAVKKLLKKT